MVHALRPRHLILLAFGLASTVMAQPAPTPTGPAATVRREEATTALIAARVELFSILVDQKKKKEALAELDAITATRNLEGDPQAQEVVLSAYLEGVEFLVELGEHRRALALGKEGLVRFDKSDLHQGYFQMSLANVYKRQGDFEAAAAALRKSVAHFEKARVE